MKKHVVDYERLLPASFKSECPNVTKKKGEMGPLVLGLGDLNKVMQNYNNKGIRSDGVWWRVR